jgi:ABC-type dipeptide/oligopeptide/nickel transport system permease subunit
VVVFGAVIIVALILVAIFAPLLAPYDPLETNLKASLEPPSMAHLLGTDLHGRDLLSRLIYGSRISILVGVAAVAIAGGVGIILGLIAGYFGGWIQTIIMRFIDAIMCIPSMVLMLTITAILGGGLLNVLVALGVAMIPTYCRLMCGQVMSIKESDFITAGTVLGASDMRIIFRHLLPNAFPPLIVLATINIGTAILAEASLSFLGIGISPPTPTWGAMVYTGYSYLLSNPLLSIVPGIAILLVVLGYNMVGDGLRDALDPRLRGII